MSNDYHDELFIYKYRPKTLVDIKRPSITYIFQKIIEKKTIPNIILYGLRFSGKKTILYAFLHDLYGDFKTQFTYREYKISTRKINIPVFYSHHHIEININSFYSSIRTILPILIKEYTQTKNVLSNKHKLFVIHHMEDLETQTQHMLRRILEMNMDNCRFIFVTTKLNKITQPLQSRCLTIQVPKFSNSEIMSILNNINTLLDIPVKQEQISLIVTNSKNNIKEAIFQLESNYFDIDIQTDYKKEINNIINIIKTSKVSKKLYEIVDTFLYTCLYKNLPLDTLLLDTFILFDDVNILNKCISSDINIIRGSRDFIHVQSFFYYLIHYVHSK